MNIPNMDEIRGAHRELCDRMDALTTALHTFKQSDQQPSPQLREWEPFVVIDGGTTDANGAATVGSSASTVVAANGWEGYVHRVSVTVAGASAAASVANYRGGVDPRNLFDFSPNLYGNTPSRIVGGYIHGVYFNDNQHVTVVVAGAVASQSVTLRVEGRRRQIQSGL